MTHPPTEDRREPDALEGCAREIHRAWCDAGFHAGHVDDILAIMRRHGLRPEPPRVTAIDPPGCSCWLCRGTTWGKARTTEEER